MKVNVKRLGRILLLVALSVCILLNSLYIGSPIIGLPVSVAFFFVSSVAVGDVFFSRENKFFKATLGFATFIVLEALFGSILIIFGVFTEPYSLVMLAATGLFFSILCYMRKLSSVSDAHRVVQSAEFEVKEKHAGLGLYFVVSAFAVSVAIGFYALATARTGEGAVSVWLTIPYYFLPSFFLCSFLLMFILFFTRANLGLKLSLIFVYSFLARSLFWIVWYPGRYGDPWVHLGKSRYIDKTGMPYAYSWMLQNLLLVDLVGASPQYALVILLKRMFNVDIYWVHVLFVPFLWSFLIPLFSYKLTDILAKRQSEKFPLAAALAASLFPTLVLWGTVSVPNSVGFIFFFFTVVLLFYWIRTGDRQFWSLSLLAAIAASLVHLQPGIFAFMFLLLMTFFQKISQTIEKVFFYLLLFVSYPFALYLLNARFSLDRLFAVESFGSLQSDIVSVTLFLGSLGVVWSVKSRYVSRRSTLLVFFLSVTVVLEYYLTMYGMLDLPFGAHRILVMADLILMPLVALGVIGVVDVLARVLSYVRTSPSFLKKIGVRFSPRLTSFALICLALSAQATVTLYIAYPHEEIVELQATVYEMEAIYYINSTAPAPYVVLCHPQLANLANGLLGRDYGYPGGRRGWFGISDFYYPIQEKWGEMVWAPSLSIMNWALDFEDWIEIAYFVLSVRTGARFEKALEETSKILPIDAVFGDGKLFVFEYPLSVAEGRGTPVKVVFDDGGSTEYVETKYSYFEGLEAEVNSTLTLFGHTSYNITEYPMHWTFLDLSVNNVSRRFDEVSDINSFVYVKGLKSDDVLIVRWHWNRNYPSAVWKEDSFKKGWRTHDLYPGTIVPTIVTDGNILNMSHSFTSGPYSYFYYIKPVNITITGNQSIMVRWKSDGPIAVVAYYHELGLRDGVNVVPLSSKSIDWAVTAFELPENMLLTYVLVGISNLRSRDLSGVKTLNVDYILISTSA